jgi:molecular chaperone HtpG
MAFAEGDKTKEGNRMQTGTISVQSENIFPIIKKFLYSDHEIFLRELVSNAVDATTKLRKLADIGEVKGEIGDITIEVILDNEAKTITIRDRGIGMTEAEVLKYLNQIAFSSATEFLDKYKDSQIIGHFGLGFYSAFMVAEKVEVRTKSWQPDAPAVQWSCDGSPHYQLEQIDKDFRGTDVVLYVSEEEAAAFLDKWKLEGLLDKYCKYLPVPIQFGTKTEYLPKEEGEADDAEEKSIEVPNIINPIAPIWKKKPSELADADYMTFYKEMYPASPEPMFHIHLNIDYPFNLTGVLYFPKLGNAVETSRNKIHLYSNQVYVTDDVRNIVPEWLQLLHGVIDSPDIPLNVSRSYLQSDGNVKKINTYITKKVADKLQDLFKTDRAGFEAKWPDLGLFVKYGMVSDEDFKKKAENFALLQNTDKECFLINDYKEKIKANQTDKNNRLVCIYTHNQDQHAGLIKSAKARGYDVLLLNTVLDNHWIQGLEYSGGTDDRMTFVRIDSDTLDKLVQKDENRESVLSDKEKEGVKKVFEGVTGGKPGIQLNLEALSPEDAPVLITQSEFMRRMKEMQMLHGQGDNMFPETYQVIVNTNHPIVAKQLAAAKGEKAAEMGQHLYDLALLQSNMLTGEALAAFVERSIASMGGKK